MFSQSGLSHLLQGAEGALGRRESCSPLMPSLLATPPPLEDGMVAATRQAVMELEGPGFNYSPLFDTEFRQNIVDLLSTAERAREAAAAGLAEVQKSEEREEGGGSSWIQWLMGEQNPSPSGSAEAEELRRCIQHLSCSTAALAEVFSVSAPGENSDRPSGGFGGGAGGSRAPERLETEAGRVLTPHGRWQLVQGIAKGEVKYEGDPDLAPITHR